MSVKEQGPSHLLTLPTEIRLRVYEVLLHRPFPIALTKQNYNLHDFAPLTNGEPSSWSKQDIRAWAIQRSKISAIVRQQAVRSLSPVVLRLSKGIHDEALPVLYAQNRFMLAHCQCMFDHRGCECATRLLRRLPQRYKGLIRHIEMCHPNICGREHCSTQKERTGEIEACFIRGLRYCWNLRTFTIHLFETTELLRVWLELQRTYARASRPDVVVKLTVSRQLESVDEDVMEWIDGSFADDVARAIRSSAKVSDMDLVFYGGTGWLSKKAQLVLTAPTTAKVISTLQGLPGISMVPVQHEQGALEKGKEYNLELSREVEVP